MTVTENLQLGAMTASQDHFEEDLELVLTLFPRLRERRTQRGGTLSGGEQQMLAIARALMSRSDEHTSELQSLMRISYAVFCLKKKQTKHTLKQHPEYTQHRQRT